MEVGWYLRLSRAREIEAWVQEGVLASLEDQRAMNSQWDMAVRAEQGYMRVVFTRGERT